MSEVYSQEKILQKSYRVDDLVKNCSNTYLVMVVDTNVPPYIISFLTMWCMSLKTTCYTA